MLETIQSNVRLLGKLLGQTIAIDHGDDFLEKIESVRNLGKDLNRDEQQALKLLQDEFSSASEAQLKVYSRAFSQFLNLVNIAEQQFTISEKGLQQLELAHPLEEFQKKLDESTTEKFEQALQKLHVELVLTAHPTEVNRRTFIHKYHDLAEQLDSPEKNSERIEELIEQAWFTNEIRNERPTPLEESRWGLDTIADSLWQAVPEFMRELNELSQQVLGKDLPLDYAPVTMASWQAGDRDGNPFVTAKLSELAITNARLRAAELYLQDFQNLYLELSMHKADENLIAQDAERIGPYRQVLASVIAQLKHSINQLQQGSTETAISSTEQLLEPLQLCYQSLCNQGLQKIANSSLLDVIRRVKCFGISMVKLDIRQHSERHDQAMAEVTQALNLGDYQTWKEEQKVAFLLCELQNSRPLLPAQKWSADTQEVLDTYAMIARQPKEVLGIYIISMASRTSDVLLVNLFLKAHGVDWAMPIAPLFETLDDLNNAPAVMAELLKLESYMQRCERQHYVMIGYSDSAKDAGVLAATWAQYTSQEALVKLFEQNKVQLKLFHGRGGTIGRGGGPAHAAIASQPPGTLCGGLRVTEQGETIRYKFGLPHLAVRSLHLYASAILESLITPPPAPKKEWRQLMDKMAEQSCASYRSYVREREDFVRYFRQATPEQELSSLPLGSRPSKRKKDGGIESLRAIPWIFAWSQNRLVVPSWLGLGQAIADNLDSNKALMQDMLKEWPYFKARISLTEMVYLKSSPEVSELYDQALVEDELLALGKELRHQLKQDEQAVLNLLGQKRVMESDSWNLSSFELRRPYLLPLHLMQVEALKRLRQNPEHPELEQILMVTMAGIATGMRNTG
ncbi:phosphoenolpyruvate carboxylase [Agaribacterium haliotis]|uniref:phosphoenolpyruvate carboxylase n=1 Tax=Agaribacterium haliotis TaxID=2013869 RepID=UPI000BB5851B|nr:phosphoenolpyruvate carboxylase [Agaribacterium haliotis]